MQSIINFIYVNIVKGNGFSIMYVNCKSYITQSKKTHDIRLQEDINAS